MSSVAGSSVAGWVGAKVARARAAWDYRRRPWFHKRRVARADRLRPVFAGMLDGLPPLQQRPTDACSAHMLCGSKTADMGVWASYSVLRFMPDVRLFVHSDGSLSDDQQRRWARAVPGTTFLPMADMDARVTAAWAGRFDALLDWRRAKVIHTKWVDANVASPCRKTLLLDSDVLCFRDPVELRRACQDGGRSLAWNADVRECYSMDSAAMTAAVGCRVPPAFNSGCAVVPKLADDDLAWVQEAMAKLVAAGVDLTHWWIEQTVLALLAGRLGGAPLPPTYAVQFFRTPPGKVLRHYVGSKYIRERFFSEGVPLVARSLGLRPRVRPF